jgi:putative peptidoglycan lipid II flippase
LFLAFPHFGLSSHLGIGAATVVGAWLNVALLYRGLRTRGHFQADHRLKVSLPMIVLASGMMGFALVAGTYQLAPWLATGRPLGTRAIGLAALVSAGGVVYFVAALVTGAIRPSQLGRMLRRGR